MNDRVITVVGAMSLAVYVIAGSGIYQKDAIACSETFRTVPVLERFGYCINPATPLFQPATEAGSDAAVAAIFSSR